MKGPAPAAKKPPNLGKKLEPKKDAGGDAPAEKKGPPALSSSKPTTSGGGGGNAKPLTPEMIVEEDLGPGMSKETAINKAQEFFKPEIHSLLEEENKWNQKVEGLQEMQK